MMKCPLNDEYIDDLKADLIKAKRMNEKQAWVFPSPFSDLLNADYCILHSTFSNPHFWRRDARALRVHSRLSVLSPLQLSLLPLSGMQSPSVRLQ